MSYQDFYNYILNEVYTEFNIYCIASEYWHVVIDSYTHTYNVYIQQYFNSNIASMSKYSISHYCGVMLW